MIVPSLPGFGFSDKPTDTTWDVLRIAKAWVVLMQRLGYKRWVAQGGDWGAGVTTALGKLKPAGLAGIHLNFQFVFPEKIPTEGLSADEQRAVTALTEFLNDGNGYFKEQATRPQTIGYALADSPSGQAAWIYEKFQAWTDSNGDPENVLTKDQMLDNISLYWLTDAAASSARIYWENRTTASPSQGRIDVPVAVSVFPHELIGANSIRAAILLLSSSPSFLLKSLGTASKSCARIFPGVCVHKKAPGSVCSDQHFIGTSSEKALPGRSRSWPAKRRSRSRLTWLSARLPRSAYVHCASQPCKISFRWLISCSRFAFKLSRYALPPSASR